MVVNNRKSITFWYKIQFLKIYYTMNRGNCTFINKKNMKIDMFVFLYRKLLVMIFFIMSNFFLSKRSQYKRWCQNLLEGGGRKQRPCTTFWWSLYYHLRVRQCMHGPDRHKTSLYRSGLISLFDTDKIEIMLSKIGSLKFVWRNR